MRFEKEPGRGFLFIFVGGTWDMHNYSMFCSPLSAQVSPKYCPRSCHDLDWGRKSDFKFIIINFRIF